MKTESTQYTRADYMAGRCTHRQYYAQFVTERIKNTVAQSIGLDAIRKSRDKHLNDIPLIQWDNLSHALRPTVTEDGKRLYSLAGGVCILKEAARQALAQSEDRK